MIEEMKPMKRKLSRRVATVIGIVAIIGIVGYVMYASNSSEASTAREPACQNSGTNHVVIIKDNVANPSKITAPRCDTLTLKNVGDNTVLMAFGEHKNHQASDGAEENQLGNNDSLTLPFNRVGTFDFHEHIRYKSAG